MRHIATVILSAMIATAPASGQIGAKAGAAKPPADPTIGAKTQVAPEAPQPSTPAISSFAPMNEANPALAFANAPLNREPPRIASRSWPDRSALLARLGASIPSPATSFTLSPAYPLINGKAQMSGKQIAWYLPQNNEMQFRAEKGPEMTGPMVTIHLGQNNGGRYLFDCLVDTKSPVMHVQVWESDASRPGVRQDVNVIDKRVSFLTQPVDAQSVLAVISYANPAAPEPYEVWTITGCEITPLPAPG